MEEKSKNKTAYLICTLAILAVASLFAIKFGLKKSVASTKTDTVAKIASNGTKASHSSPSPEILSGEWLRDDGGYVLVLANITPPDKLEAKYYNPRPINVSNSNYSEKEGELNVFIELRDEGYPGCTYNLRYDKFSDSLIGDYNQTAMGQTFRIIFRRQKT